MNGFARIFFSSLLPGRYQVARVDFTMEVGGLVEAVSVEASGILLNAATSTIGTVVENRQITELPLSGTNPIALVALTPGVRIQGGFGGKGQWSNFSVNGGLANANTVLVEGLALDYAQMNSPAYVPRSTPRRSFVSKRITSLPNMGSAGAVVNFSIKSGCTSQK